MEMITNELYRGMGLGHATVSRWLEAAFAGVRGDEQGQGTVEYIGLVLLLAAIAGFVAKNGHGAQIGGKVVKAVKDAIDSV